MKKFQEKLYPIIETYKARYSHSYSRVPVHFVSSHWHNAYEVLYVRRGYGKQQLNAEILDICPGNVIIICPGDVHATDAVADDGCDIDCVQFSGDLVYNSKETLQSLRSCVVNVGDDSIKKLFDAMLHNHSKKSNGKDLIITGLIYTLCGFLVRMSLHETQAKYSKTIEKVCMYTKEETDIRLENVAAYFNYSPEHLSRKFHREMGISYRDWCNRILMDRAVYLLKSEDNTIAFIAESLGYSDESSFTRAFKRMYGITPSTYRHSNKDTDL